MAAKENRFIRIEDWNGNVYIPEMSNGGGSTSGDIIDSSTAITASPFFLLFAMTAYADAGKPVPSCRKEKQTNGLRAEI